MAKVTDEEKQDIAELIQEGLTLSEIEKATGRSKNTIYRTAKEFDLTLQKKEQEGSPDSPGGPYGESDRETYTAVKSFVKGHSRRHVNAIIDTGQLLHHKYEATARELEMELADFAEKAIDFFLEESVMVNAYRDAIKHKNREIQALKATLDTATLMRDHLRDLSMALMMAGKKVDYESALNSAKALATAVNQIEIGEFEYGDGRRQADRDGSRIGNIEEGAAEELPEQGDDTDGIGDTDTDTNGLEPTEPESLPDDDGHYEPSDDGEDGDGRPSETEQ